MGLLALALVVVYSGGPCPPGTLRGDAPLRFQQAPSPQGASAAQPAAPRPEPPAETYNYNPDGRRDPFLSLVGAGNDQRGAPSRRGEGIAGMTLAEISVRGVLQSRGTLIAMVQGPDNRTYMVRQGDKFADGVVQSVTAEGLMIVQEVNDPLSLIKQRVVRKPLRSLEDVKP
jgi:type IV pilus assembly protein PilP